MTKSRLGKGLGALITEKNLDESESLKDKVKDVIVKQIEVNPFQPRQEFAEESLQELAQSIKEKGLIQPLTLRKIKPNQYQLVTGERRLRAACLIGMKSIPAIIREYSDLEMMEIALIENLQREDLNPMEEAQAYQRIINEFNITQKEVAQKVGKSRSSVANFLRLLNLPPKVQIYVSRETISMGHARAILAIKDPEVQLKLAEKIVEKGLSVRETERYMQNIKRSRHDKTTDRQIEPVWQEAEKSLSNYLGLKVKVKKKKEKRLITIECKDYQDMEKILKEIKKD